MNWYKTFVRTKSGFSTDDVPHLSKGQLLNLISMEVLDESPEREKIEVALNALIAMQDRWLFHIGNAIMEKVDRMLFNPSYPDIRDRQWPTDEIRLSARADAVNLLRDVMNRLRDERSV